MMMQQQPTVVNPYASAAKTAEIMSRYRPIAPKPMDGGDSSMQGGGDGGGSVDGMSDKIQQSPYLRNMWPKLQARPTRTRKRGRMIGVSVSPSHFKRISPPQVVGCQGAAAAFLGLPLTPHHPQFYPVSGEWFGRGFMATDAAEKAAVRVGTLITLPLLPSSPVSTGSPDRNVEKGMIDLKSMVKMTPEEEKDLTLQLRGPAVENSGCSSGSSNLISPQPIRLVGSCITVTTLTPVNATHALTNVKTSKVVEAEIEADKLPAIVTDWRNKVRLTNSAYNEMVGQPKCLWLDGRINGEVLIKTTKAEANMMHHGSVVAFNGRVTIEWGSKETKKTAAIDASCIVERLRCVSNDYVFAWRFKAI